MANIKDNRRAQYTKTALRRALLTLMLEKSVDRITVKELCTAADINRGTFYAHYATPEQLLAQIENEFYLDILTEVASFQRADDVERIFTKALSTEDKLEFKLTAASEEQERQLEELRRLEEELKARKADSQS